MKTSFAWKALFGCAVWLAALPVPGAAQAAAPQAAARPSFCGGQPGCYETGDFAATITDFRVSTAGYWKVIDATIRFQNKTNQPLILGYNDGSGMAIDDQGNRYSVPGQPNAVRGIARIAGNNVDPKFMLQPGGTGDALFELSWMPGNATQGVNFEMDLTVREVTALEGHQFALAGEFPLQFRGLANGVSAAGRADASGQASAYQGSGSTAALAAAPVCGATGNGVGNAVSTVSDAANSLGGQKVSGAANSTISNAAATLSTFKSMFGRKKAAPAAATSTLAAAVPCVPAASAPDASAYGTSAAATPPGTGATAGAATGVSPAASTIRASSRTAAGPAPVVRVPPTSAASQKALLTAKPVASTTTANKTTTTPTSGKPAAKKPPASPGSPNP